MAEKFPEKVLVVDDEPSLVELVTYNLKRAGYETVTAGDGEEALQIAERENPDLVILDLMLPKLDGFEVCKAMRQVSAVPIVMLTARTDEVDRVVGLELGADDYVLKPFSPRELVARVKAILRRAALERGPAAGAAELSAPAAGRASATNRAITAGPLLIDPDKHRATVAGQVLPLTYTEFKILWTLASSPGRVFERDALLTRIWGEDFFGDARTVDVHVRHLRQKLQEGGAEEEFIETVRGVGYRFKE
ncbi:MAG: response regulator [Bacillota bacterium]